MSRHLLDPLVLEGQADHVHEPESLPAAASAHGEHSVVLEVTVEVLDGLDRVEVGVVERVSPYPRRSPGIDSGQSDHVIAVRIECQEVPSLDRVKPDLRSLEE